MDVYPDHTTWRKCNEKILPGVKSKIDPIFSKMHGLIQAYSEIAYSDYSLADKVEQARNEAIKKIEHESKQLLKCIATLNNELTEEQATVSEERIKELQLSLLLYQGQTLQTSNDLFTWYHAEILSEKKYVKFHHTRDTDEFQVEHSMALIKSQEINFLSIGADCLRSPSKFTEREEKERELEREGERILSIAIEIHGICLESKPDILELECIARNYIKKLGKKTAKAIEIINNKYYIPPPNSLESELSMIYKTAQESLVIVDTTAKYLINFINEPINENIIEEFSMFSQKTNFLQQKIELCNEFLALLKEPVFNNHLDGSGI